MRRLCEHMTREELESDREKTEHWKEIYRRTNPWEQTLRRREKNEQSKKKLGKMETPENKMSETERGKTINVWTANIGNAWKQKSETESSKTIFVRTAKNGDAWKKSQRLKAVNWKRMKRKLKNVKRTTIANDFEENGDTTEQKIRREKVRMLRRQQGANDWTYFYSAIVDKFLKNVKDAADCVCCSCNRLMYRSTVLWLKEMTFTKLPKQTLNDVLGFRRQSADGKEWICRTC